MSIDKRILSAVSEVIKEKSQTDALETRIVSWLECLFEGKEKIDNKEDVYRRLQIILNSTNVSLDGDSE